MNIFLQLAKIYLTRVHVASKDCRLFLGFVDLTHSSIFLILVVVVVIVAIVILVIFDYC